MTTTLQPETSPIMATIEIAVERREGETKHDAEKRLMKITLAAVCPGSKEIIWENNKAIWRLELDAARLVSCILTAPIGEHLFRDRPICPACNRVFENK